MDGRVFFGVTDEEVKLVNVTRFRKLDIDVDAGDKEWFGVAKGNNEHF